MPSGQQLVSFMAEQYSIVWMYLRIGGARQVSLVFRESRYRPEALYRCRGSLGHGLKMSQNIGNMDSSGGCKHLPLPPHPGDSHKSEQIAKLFICPRALKIQMVSWNFQNFLVPGHYEITRGIDSHHMYSPCWRGIWGGRDNHLLEMLSIYLKVFQTAKTSAFFLPISCVYRHVRKIRPISAGEKEKKREM